VRCRPPPAAASIRDATSSAALAPRCPNLSSFACLSGLAQATSVRLKRMQLSWGVPIGFELQFGHLPAHADLEAAWGAAVASQLAALYCECPCSCVCP
jgi:hypothetical protein